MSLRGTDISHISLAEYFSKGIVRETKSLSPPLSEGVVHYVTHVLIHFSESNNLFGYIEGDHYSLPLLAMLYKEAYNAPTNHQRTACLRQLGDRALFMGALFYEFYARKGINKDYFIGMGGGAYSSLGDQDYGDAKTFYELAERFPKLLQVVANVCSKELNYSAEDIFSLLERWQLSKDETLRQQLTSLGVIPAVFNRYQ